VLTSAFRTVLFGSFIASGYVPMVHNHLLHGAAGLHYFPLGAALRMNVLDFFGAAFYVSRFPEAYFPSSFDIWVSTHPNPHPFAPADLNPYG
jgi:adiponectin receptor